ncbi:2Fe-2S iron-sulfur cluster-binding protein [Bacillus horti]|uniref:2Fe-2S ferredoxin n=1 Tax=Caldalkalibacillus horti TaxID=77523 RepID=A0ABT9W1C5_9BACI|nr:2Fe-2S iron-sulfur cluster-binding protein [Bacillus horti]MDQ0166862.1 2Fe-2S ferredoxin [Bacillus horti]
MAKITFTSDNKQIQCKQSETILQVAIRESLEVRHKCGGKGSCTTCKIKVIGQSQGKVSSPTQIEHKLLGEIQLENGYRLACQTKALEGDIYIERIEDPLKALIRRQLEANKNENKNEI